MRWISVNDRLPALRGEKSRFTQRESDIVLIYVPVGNCRGIYDACRHEDGRWRGAGLSVDYLGDGDLERWDEGDVSHWMELKTPFEDEDK